MRKFSADRAKPRHSLNSAAKVYTMGRFAKYTERQLAPFRLLYPYHSPDRPIADRTALYGLKMRRKLAANRRAFRKPPVRLRLPTLGVGTLAGGGGQEMSSPARLTANRSGLRRPTITR